jgi:hypothetical protein
MANAEMNANVNSYDQQQKQYKTNTKWWFDPNADYNPTFSEFYGAPPSAEATAQNNQGAQIVSGLAQGAGAGARAGSAFGLEGTAIGAGVGAVAGGIWGEIENVMAVNDGKSQDANQKSQAMSAYEKQLTQWTIGKNNARMATTQQMNEAAASKAATAKETAIGNKAEESNDDAAYRQRLLTMLSQTSAAKAAKNKKLLNPWG